MPHPHLNIRSVGKERVKLVRLKRDFFNQPTIKVAKELLGKFLVRKIGQKTLIGRIVETEAYIGPDDKASHASFGQTKRCQPMYGPPGIAYVYFIYGMYWMLNIVTEKKGQPCAVLIRAVEPRIEIEKLEIKKLRKLGSGPGKLCRWMRINGYFNGEDLTRSRRLFVAKKVGPCKSQGPTLNKKEKIISATRIGVDYAGQWAKKLWRFYLKDNLFVSRK